jgi:hypothetical protein
MKVIEVLVIRLFNVKICECSKSIGTCNRQPPFANNPLDSPPFFVVFLMGEIDCLSEFFDVIATPLEYINMCLLFVCDG